MERKIYFEKYDLFIKYTYTQKDLSIFEYFRYLFIYLFILFYERLMERKIYFGKYD